MREIESLRSPNLEDGDARLVPLLIWAGLLCFSRRLDAVKLSLVGARVVGFTTTGHPDAEQRAPMPEGMPAPLSAGAPALALDGLGTVVSAAVPPDAALFVSPDGKQAIRIANLGEPENGGS